MKVTMNFLKLNLLAFMAVFFLASCVDVSDNQEDTDVQEEKEELIEETGMSMNSEQENSVKATLVSNEEAKTYNAFEIESAPVFSKDCLNEADKKKCSDRALIAYLKDNLEYPETAEQEAIESTEVISFVINEEGKIDGKIKAVSQQSDCAECQAEAVRVIAGMPEWTPGLKDGKPVRVKMTVPVKFVLE